MRTFLKSKKGITILVVSLIVVLLTVGVGCYFIFRKKLNLDWEKGAKAVELVENAQYVPDMDKFLEANNPVGVRTELNGNKKIKPLNSSSEETVSTMSSEEFADLIDTYGKIKNNSGVGKYSGYDIYEIKEEIKFVIEHVPAFNQWFRMPDMGEEQGYISIPYYEWWSYYLEMDEQNRLSITRVCTSTGDDYIDFNNQTTVSHNLHTYEIMKTNYYVDEDGNEVVECYIYCVGIKNARENLKYYGNSNDYYPLEYMYLKNVKDKSLIKYNITASKKYGTEMHRPYQGFDLRGLNPYGVQREIMVANYDGYTQVDLTKISQQFAMLDNPEYDGIVNFNVNSDNVKKLIKNINLQYSEYENSATPNELLDKISRQIVDNFELKNNWQNIYKNSANAFKIDKIYGKFHNKSKWLNDVDVDVYCNKYGNNYSLRFVAEGSIYDKSKFDTTKEYSLSIALKNRENGNIYIVVSDYKPCLNASGEYRQRRIEASFYTSTINISENGEYDFTAVLTVKENGKDVVVFDTLQIAYLQSYFGLEIPNSIDENNVEHKYTVKGTGGKLTIIVSSVEND